MTTCSPFAIFGAGLGQGTFIQVFYNHSALEGMSLLIGPVGFHGISDAVSADLCMLLNDDDKREKEEWEEEQNEEMKV